MIREEIFYRYSFVTSLIVIFVGILVLIGWQFDIILLKSIATSMTAMNPVTAVCFMLAGVWLFIFIRTDIRFWQRILLLLLSLVVATVGILKTMSYATKNVSTQVDQWLFTYNLSYTIVPNRIAPNTALIFSMIGISMVLLLLKKQWSLVAAQVLLVLSFSLAYLSFTGYVYSVEPAYRFGPFIPMALNTAISFLVLIAGIFFSISRKGIASVIFSDLTGGRMSRKIIPFILTVLPLIGYIRLMGERQTWYTTEYGVALHSIFFVIVLIIFVFVYAKQLNDKERKRIDTEKLIASNEQRYRTLVSALREGVVLIDLNGKIEFCNESYCYITGYHQNELIGENAIEILVPERQRDSFYEKLQKRKTGEHDFYETEFLTKNGERIWVEITSTPVKDDDDNIRASLGTIVNITERKNQFEDLKAFTASAAHDLSSPLARIEMISNFLLEKEGNRFDEESKTLLQGMVKTSKTMRQLLQDLISFTRIGSTDLTKEELAMKDLAERIVEEIRETIPNHANIHVYNLPDAFGDKGAIKQVLTNLISNAIKYSSKKADATIEVNYNTEKSSVIYYVKDNGAGFDVSKADKLFAVFKRYHNSDEFEGTGLGLAIVKRIIEKHGGRIWAESTINEGATFYFTLS